MVLPWNHLEHKKSKKPKPNVPVLVVKRLRSSLVVREAIYQGSGYWCGPVDAPVLAWLPMPLPPVSLELRKILDERDAILDREFRSTKDNARLLEIDRIVERADQKRENEYERLIRRAAEAVEKMKPSRKK